MVGAVIGIVVGLVPGLHKAFFASPDKGGFFNAWITSSVRNIGDLFATLQVMIVGVLASHVAGARRRTCWLTIQ
jgi:auxin efflux carrier family protein